MTAPDDQKEKTAAVGFMAFMGLALGPLGVLVAALAVGIERAWNGGATERSRAAERSRGWLDGQRAWLDADHEQRIAQRSARTAWLSSGADPSSEPGRPSLMRRMGAGLRRLIAHVALAGSDFKDGAKDGWKAAQEERRNGGSFRDIATARPEVCSTCKRERVPVVADGLCGDCRAAAEESWRRPAGQEPAPETPDPGSSRVEPAASGSGMTTASTPDRLDGRPYHPRPGAEAPAHPHGDGIHTCPRCGGPVSMSPRLGRYCVKCDAVEVDKRQASMCDTCGQPGWCVVVRPRTEMNPDRKREGALVHDLNQSTTCPTSEQVKKANSDAETARSRIKPDAVKAGYAGSMSWAPDSTTPGTNQQEEKPMPETTGKNPTASAPVTESNATVLRQKLNTTKGTLGRMAELTDQLAAERSTLGHQVRDASEFATSTGQSAQAQQALDESDALASSMGEQLGNFSQGAVSAEASMSQASDGLRVAENAEDALRSAGADGRAVAPASGANA